MAQAGYRIAADLLAEDFRQVAAGDRLEIRMAISTMASKSDSAGALRANL
ncbi:hypothetical protein [Shinella sp. CPCC 101442]